MIQLGFASAIVPELSLEEVLALASTIGYDCVEVMCWPVSKAERRYAGITHIDLSQLDDSRVAEILSLMDRTGVAISALGYYPNCLAPDVEEAAGSVAHLKRLIESAPRLGIDRVTTFIGRDFTKSVEENWPRMLETWKPIVALAEEHQVRIGIENCPMLFSADEWPGGKNLATTPAIWRRMFEDLGSPNLGLNYDPSHMIWQHMDYLKPMRDFASRIFHAHAKDVRIDHEKLNEVGILAHPAEYHTPKLPGLGDVDWGKFFSTLVDTGYRGPVCVEVEDRAYEGSLEDRQDSLRQSYRYLKNFIP
ncbi:sugar phosphate isomerase/epimerase family protein [Aureliella helgolandensis]|uniref:Inosose dehydratase n=1 Tax=Aureliella helgolandensis TaxID=2527968 RepID=A0A518G135_9BACT|nr:sugar phosphate isomerase/epimerase [Aureliella helgolandensis]QDV22313.1 Inosose dehydratase [Aureliella helgolandensis]